MVVNRRKDRRPDLADVTVCAADSVSPALTARALDICLERCAFADAILFSDVPTAGSFHHVAIPKLTSLGDYSRFCLAEMGRYIKTEHALVVQWDGYIVDPAAWDELFRTYDYVGAPIFRDGRVVIGNGGFSLRSRKLMRALAKLPAVPGVNEDWVISEIMRPVLERDFNIRFAPPAVAAAFSYEQRHPGNPTFGFHGQANLYRHETDAEVLAIYGRLPADALVSLNGFGLIVMSLKNNRRDLAQRLYARLRDAHDIPAIQRKAMSWVSPAIVRETIDVLEAGLTPTGEGANLERSGASSRSIGLAQRNKVIGTTPTEETKQQKLAERIRTVFYIACPTYTETSSGVRCLYILCHHLNRLGYKAFVTGAGAPPHLWAPRITRSLIMANRRTDVDDIVIYPEVIAGNPFAGRKVARYLLNKPGQFNSIGMGQAGSAVHMDRGMGMEGYGPTDFFLHFAEEFRPLGLNSFHLPLPLVDPAIYRKPNPQPDRRGFVLYSSRHVPVLSELPAWVSPYTMVSMADPRSATELAALYQGHVALVLWERSAAASEAIQCGCPVIVIPGPRFAPDPMVRRYRGNGFVIGWDRVGLKRAQKTVEVAAGLYRQRFRKLDRTIHEFVWRINQHFAGHPAP